MSLHVFFVSSRNEKDDSSYCLFALNENENLFGDAVFRHAELREGG